MRNRAEFISVLQDALEAVREPRFFKTERGFQGELISELKARLPNAGFPHDPIVEQEYQKTIPKHKLDIRPDLIIHVPFDRGLHERRTEGNFVAIELKRDKKDVRTAFKNLRQMAQVLHYPITIFIMIDSDSAYVSLCPKSIAGQTVCFAVRLEDGTAVVRRWSAARPSGRRASVVRKRRRMDPALEVRTAGAPNRQGPDSCLGGEDGGGESPLGRAAHPRRAAYPRSGRVGTHRLASLAVQASSPVADVAHLSDQPRGHAGLDGLLHGAQANAFCERLIGSMRRECLDWLILLNERHLRSVLMDWVAHYNHGRPHASLGPGIPDPQGEQTRELTRGHRLPVGCRVIAKPVLGGLHHEYRLESAA